MKQNKLLDVMPECYVDTGLIEYLLSAGVNHQHCCAKVVGQLKTTFADRFAIGIIDKDKRGCMCDYRNSVNENRK